MSTWMGGVVMITDLSLYLCVWGFSHSHKPLQQPLVEYTFSPGGH